MTTRATPALHLHVGAIVALALITGVGYLAGVRPLLASQVEAWNLEQAVQEKRAIVDDLRTDLATTRKDLAHARQSLDSVEVNLVGSSLINSQLAKLGIAAEEVGVVLTETAPGQSEEGSSLVRIPIRIAGKGHYPDFARFLHLLDDRMKDVVVVGFSLSGRAETPTEPATFSVDLLWYALREHDVPDTSEGTSRTKSGSKS
jgi:Tfp pilus assembly protein PilO